MAYCSLRLGRRLAGLGLAVLLLAPGTALAAVAEQVQSGTAVNTANGIQVINIAGIDPTKSFLIFETRHNFNRPVASALRGRLPIACVNPCTTIEFERVTNEGVPVPINIQWYVVTFATGVRVQRGEVVQDALVKNVTLPLALSSVSQAFVLFSKTMLAVHNNWDTDDAIVTELIDTATLQIRNNEGSGHIITWQVIEFTNPADINVQTGSITTMTGATLSVSANFATPVDANKTFVMVGYRTTVANVPAIGAHVFRATLTDTTITIDRATAGVPNEDITEIFWQAIELKDKTIVASGSANFPAGVAQVNVPMLPHFDASRSIAFGSVQTGGGQNIGRTTYVGDDIQGSTAFTMALSATQLTLQRDSTLGVADVGWFMLQFEQTNDARIVSGSYTGNGVNLRGIDVGFEPDFVIVKASGQTSVFRTGTMAVGSSKQSTVAAALVTNRILDFDTVNGGRFTVGTDAQVNTNGTIYYWTAFKAGAGKMAFGTYSGNNVTPVSVAGLGFSPEAVFVMGEGTQSPVLRIAGMANSTRFTADVGNANRITSLNADGFTLGLDAEVSAVPSTVTFHYVAWNEVKGDMDVGTYNGNAVDSRNIAGVGFPPELVIVKNVTADLPVLRSSSMDFVADSTANFTATVNATNKIQALQTDGFQVGTNVEVNENATAIFYAAWARSQQPILITGDYAGNATDNTVVSGLSFQPDVVIVKGNLAQGAVIRTSTMAGDLAKPVLGGVVVANLVQSLDLSGFTIGTDVRVNSNAGCPGACMPYWFAAFKAGPGTMKVGTYTGNGLAGGQSIIGVGFSPELVFIIPANATEAIHRSSASTEAHNFANSGVNPLWISTLNADGFSVTTTDTHVNAAGVVYHYVAWNQIPGQMRVGTYVGNNLDNRNIIGVGFEPEYLIAKRFGAAQYATQFPASLGRSNDTAMGFIANPNITPGNNVQALQPDGFQIGDGTGQVNTTGGNYAYYAWKRPDPAAMTLTAVRLTKFEATRYDNRVLLKWRTGYEIDNLGFHVYREVDGKMERVTRSLIAGSGLLSGQGAAVTGDRGYAFWDTTGTADRSAAYFLEDRAFNGKSTWHGPVRPVNGGLEAPPTVTTSTALRDLGKHTGPGPDRRRVLLERGARLDRDNSGPAGPVVGATEMQRTLAGRAAVKISVNRPGWYRITQPELVAAGLPSRAKARTLRLFVDGVEQALMVAGEADGLFGPADAIEFYGTGVDTPYTDTRTYWLVADSRPGLRMKVHARAGLHAPAVGTASFDFTVQRKDRTIYFAALRNGEDENWFGEAVLDEPSDLVFDLPNVAAGGAAELEMSLQGVTEGPGTDHVVAIAVNGTEIGELRFSGAALGVESFAIAPGLLVEGANTVTVVARGGEADVSLFNFVRLRYAHTYRADADLLRFSADATGTITVGGFASSAIRVIDITDPMAAEELRGTIVAEGGGLSSVKVLVPGGGPRTLLAFTDSTVTAPALVRANRPSRWNASTNQADYLAVFHPAFAEALDPLVARREQQGLSVLRADIEDVYDEFSFGQKTPQALKDFMQHARANWNLAPRFLLLVGDATIDPRDYAGFGDADFVPTKQIALAGAELETASDDWFVDMDGQGLPGMAIGRLPVRTLDQANTTVSKTLAYEADADAPWQKDLLFVADVEATHAGNSFEAASEQLAALVPQDYTSHELFASELGGPGLRAALAAEVAAGRLIVNYSGHGSTQLWGVNGDLLRPEDINAWTNARLPFVIAMNCLNGLFHGIYGDVVGQEPESLAETLLRAPDGGAVAVWASSGITDASMQTVMTRELYRLVFRGGVATLGQMVAAAKGAVSDGDVRRSWIFFGDPALRLKGIGAASTPAVPTLQTGTERDRSETKRVAEPEAERDEPAAAVVRLGDFTGDGRADLFLYDAELGAWTVSFSDSDLGAVSGTSGAGLQVSVGRLNADAAADLVFYRAATGEWAEALNAGPGRFVVRASGTGVPHQQLLLADFTGEGLDDRLMYDPRTGTVAVTTHDTHGVVTEARRTWPLGVRLYAADYNGDGFADLAGHDAQSGRGFVALRTKTDFVLVDTKWGAGWAVTPARLSDARRSDLVFYNAQSGAARVAVSDSRGGFTSQTYTWPSGLALQAADLEGDGRDDLFGYSSHSGAWWTAAFSSDGISESKGEWTGGWHAATGDLDGDGRTDVVLYDPLTGFGFRFHTVSPGLFEYRAESWRAGATLIGR